MVDEFHDQFENSDEDDQYPLEDDENGLLVLEKEWEDYQEKYHPEMSQLNKYMPSLTIACDEYAGLDEPFGSVSACNIVWGHYIGKDSFNTQKSTDIDGMEVKSSNFCFPENAKAIFLDFMARFYLKICLKEKDATDQRITDIKKTISSQMKEGIFANVRGY